MIQLTKEERKLANREAHIKVIKNNLKIVVDEINDALVKKDELNKEISQLSKDKEELVSFVKKEENRLQIRGKELDNKEEILAERKVETERLYEDQKADIEERGSKLRQAEQIHDIEISESILKIKDLTEEIETLQYELEMMIDAQDDLENMIEEAKAYLYIARREADIIEQSTEDQKIENKKELNKATKELEDINAQIKESQDKVKNPLEALAAKEEELKKREKAMEIKTKRLERMMKTIKENRQYLK